MPRACSWPSTTTTVGSKRPCSKRRRKSSTSMPASGLTVAFTSRGRRPNQQSHPPLGTTRARAWVNGPATTCFTVMKSGSCSIQTGTLNSFCFNLQAATSVRRSLPTAAKAGALTSAVITAAPQRGATSTWASTATAWPTRPTTWTERFASSVGLRVAMALARTIGRPTSTCEATFPTMRTSNSRAWSAALARLAACFLSP